MDKEEQWFGLIQHKHMRKSLQNDIAEGEVSKNKNKKLAKVKLFKWISRSMFNFLLVAMENDFCVVYIF